MAAISIIVPIYNVEEYVGKCLESLVCQTFSDIEIICVDDASTDGSISIVEMLETQDKRIRIIRHAENMGTLLTRKHGVEASTGDYIIFLDSDDWLETIACEKLYSIVLEQRVDMLHFGTNVRPATTLSDEMVQWVKKFLEPYVQRVNGKDILRMCFIENRFNFNITDKIWNGALCRKVFASMADQRMVSSEDRYAFFLLSYYAESYLGIENAKYYNYNIGVGITGGNQLDLERFEKRCSGVAAVQATRAFLEKEKVLYAYKIEFQEFENKILWDCVDCWHNKLAFEDLSKGYDILLQYWDVPKVVSAIARMYFEQKDEVELGLQNSTKIHKNMTAGIYYRYLGYEPMQMFIKSQMRMIRESGWEVVLFTDSDSNCQKNFTCDKIIKLPPSELANWGQYEERCVAFSHYMKEQKIDFMFYASPTSHIAWLDALLIQSLGIPLFYMDEHKAIDDEKSLSGKKQKVKSDRGSMENKYEELNQNYVQLLDSKTYKSGQIIMWLPKKVKSFFAGRKDI